VTRAVSQVVVNLIVRLIACRSPRACPKCFGVGALWSWQSFWCRNVYRRTSITSTVLCRQSLAVVSLKISCLRIF